MSHPSIDQQITFLYTRDLEATDRFYHEVLGLGLALDQGDCRVYRVGQAAFIGFCTREGAPKRPEGVILTLVTQEVDRWYDALCERGVVFEKPPAYNPRYGIYHCFLRDPNGYLVEIQHFLDPDWAGTD